MSDPIYKSIELLTEHTRMWHERALDETAGPGGHSAICESEQPDVPCDTCGAINAVDYWLAQKIASGEHA